MPFIRQRNGINFLREENNNHVTLASCESGSNVYQQQGPSSIGWAVADKPSAYEIKIKNQNLMIAGIGEKGGYIDGEGSQAMFNYPQGIAAGNNGNLYVVDNGNHCTQICTSTF